MSIRPPSPSGSSVAPGTEVGQTLEWDGDSWAPASGTTVLEDRVDTFEETISTTFADLATPGPEVTVTIGASGMAMVFITAQMQNTAAAEWSQCGVAVSGATTRAVSADEVLAHRGTTFNGRATVTEVISGLTPGVNVFTVKYNVSGTGTGQFGRRHLLVLPL